LFDQEPGAQTLNLALRRLTPPHPQRRERAPRCRRLTSISTRRCPDTGNMHNIFCCVATVHFKKKFQRIIPVMLNDLISNPKVGCAGADTWGRKSRFFGSDSISLVEQPVAHRFSAPARSSSPSPLAYAQKRFDSPRLPQPIRLRRKLRSTGRPKIKSPARWWKRPSAFTEVYPTAAMKSFKRTRIARGVAFGARCEPSLQKPIVEGRN
jgi:hypothetical protein